MASFLMVRVDIPSKTDTDLNSLLKPTKPHAGVQELINLLLSIEGGVVDASVDVAVRATTQAITADGAGLTASYNLK